MIFPPRLPGEITRRGAHLPPMPANSSRLSRSGLIEKYRYET